MLCLEVKVGDDIQVGDVLIRTRTTGSSRRTRVFIDAPRDIKIIKNPGPAERNRRVRAVSEMALS